jgi:hypothetical protein
MWAARMARGLAFGRPGGKRREIREGVVAA